MFDIDKLFLSTIYYNKHDKKDASGNVLSRTVSREFKEGTEEYYANRLILDYISLLKDSKSIDDATTRSMQIGDASIDNDTKLLTDIVDDLEGSKEEDLDPYDTYSLWRNTSIRDQFITGKFGIGPFALNNNNHILTMLYGVRFAHKAGSILDITGHESLCDAEDMYGESIMSWLSGLINAHVDVAKDPYISKLNVNKFTYNLVNLMIRTGFGKTTFYFMTQPIMKLLALRVNNAASAYGDDSNKSKYRRQKDAEKKFIVDYANRHLEEGQKPYETVDEVLSGFKKRLQLLGTSKTALYESIFNKDSELLRNVAKSKTDIDADGSYVVDTQHGKVKLSMFDVQMLVYAAKADFDEYAEGMSQLVKYCKIDTKKQGKNITEQRDFGRGYNRLFMKTNSKLHKLFDAASLQSLRSESYIATKTTLAMSMFSDILSDQLLDATSVFNTHVEEVLRELPVEDENISQKLAKKVSDAIMAQIRSDYFNSYASRNDIDIKGLVSGSNTIYDRLNRIKIAIQTQDKYAPLRDSEGHVDNYLLNVITSGYTHEQIISEDQPVKALKETYPDAKFISTMTFMSDDSIDADEVSEAWEELLEDTRYPELQEFARDLIVYSFITNGGNGGSNNLFKYIPMSWIANPDNAGYDVSFAHDMAQKLRNYQTWTTGSTGFDIDDVILNNWTDEQFIPTIDIAGADTFYTGRSAHIVKNGTMLNPNTDIPVIIRGNYNSKFIKIRRSFDPESQKSVAIYKRVKETQSGSVYVLVDPKGQNFGSKNKILEYGRSDASVSEVAKQLKLNSDLTNLAEILGADMSSMESVLDKLISLVESKEDRKKTLEVIKKQGTEGLLYDIIEELTDEDDVLPYDTLMDSRMTRQDRLAWNRSNQNSRIQPKMYNRSEAEEHSRVLYIFTDNTDRTSGSGVIDDNSWYAKEYGKGLHYPTKTSAVVRGLDNARPVSTQRWYHEGAKGETGRWNDSDFDEFKKVIDKEFQDIFDAWNSGQYDYIYVPANVQSEDLYTNGIFNGKISQLTEERTPRLYHYLQDKMMGLNELVSGVKSPTIINSIEDAIQVLESPEFTPKEAPANAEEAKSQGKSTYVAPEIEVKDVSAEDDTLSQVNEKREEFYSKDDLLTPLLPYSAVRIFNDSKDILGDLLKLFNEEKPVAHMQKTAYGSYDGNTNLFRHVVNRWVVLGVRDKSFGDNLDLTGIEYGRKQIKEWLTSKGIPTDFIQITDGGLVRINNNYINKNRRRDYVKKFKNLGSILKEKCGW